MRKTVLIFASLSFALLALFKLSTYSVLSGSNATEILIAAIALIFFGIGITIQKKILHLPKTPASKINHKKIEELGLSKREHEVLCQIALGLSNQEIASKLFVSESTIKTHVSNILVKLDAKRRTQAVQIAKALRIIEM